MLAEPAPRLGEALRQRHQIRYRKHLAQRRRPAERLAQRREVARPAAPEAQPGQCPLDVGATAQALAQLRA